MTGLAWTAAIWASMALAVFALRNRYPRLRAYFSRENLALLIALLGTFSVTAGVTEAEEVLREPVVLERVIRGLLAGMALVIAGPILINRLRQPRDPGYRAISAIVIYLGVALMSTLYSAAPLVTGAKIFEIGAGLTAVLAIAYGPNARRRLDDTVTLVLVSQLALLAVGVVGFFLVPELFGPFETRPGFVSPRTLAPPFMHSNAVSSASALILTYALAKLVAGRSARPFWAAGLVISTMALILSSGRQGVAMALAGVALVLWVERRKLFTLLIGPAAVLLFIAYQQQIIVALSRDRPSNWITLSGRLPWWEAAVTSWEQHPWTGWGYSTGGRFVALQSIGSDAVSSVHSGFLEVLVGVGILGAIPFLYALGRIVVWAVKKIGARSDTALAVLIVPLVIRTAVSPGFGGWLNVEFVLFALLAALADLDAITGRLARKGPTGRRLLDQDNLLSSDSIESASL
jgi:O-antigen ligase